MILFSFFSAAAALCVGAFKPSSGGGPTTTPSWIAIGTADTTGTASAAPAYGTNAAGDLFVMTICGRITALTTPAGWTLQAGPNDQTGRRVYILTRDARSTGGESGTVSVTLTANSMVATIHTFRNVATSSFVEDVTNGGNPGNGSTVAGVGITAGGNNRLAVFVVGSGTNVSHNAAVTGATGGTYTVRDHFANPTGGDSGYCLQTAPLDTGGTVSGGSATISGIDEHSAIGLALVGV